MAISYTHYKLLRELRARDLLPQGGRILEIGKANWYGDGGHELLRSDWESWYLWKFPDKPPVEFDKNHGDGFRVVELVYQALFDTMNYPGERRIDSIDLDPAAVDALRHDLNQPIDFHDRYDVVINHGTAEHICNIGNVWQVAHDAAMVNGLMIHETPYNWPGHGFYNVNPTLFYDLASANGYEILTFALEHLQTRTYFHVPSRGFLDTLEIMGAVPTRALWFVAFRKTTDAPFVFPQQGVYAGAAGENEKRAWHGVR